MNFIEEVKAAIIDNDNSANRINNNDEEFDEALLNEDIYDPEEEEKNSHNDEEFDEALLNEDIYDPEEEEKNSHFSWMARK